MNSVNWTDMEDESVSVIGEQSPVTLRCEEWPHRPEWAAAVWIGRGAQAICIYSSGRKGKGHPCREEAKAAAVAGLRAWLDEVQAGLDGGGR